MFREGIYGSKEPFKAKYTPELVTPDMAKTIGVWRLLTVDDNRSYFIALEAIKATAEDRSTVISTILGNPDVSFYADELAAPDPMTAGENEAFGYKAAITDATGIGLYLAGQNHPEFPSSWTDVLPPKSGKIGRAAIKALHTLNRQSRMTLETIDKKSVLDMDKLFTSTTSVAWQYFDSFEADTVSLALVRMSALPKEAKKVFKIIKSYQRWSKRFESTTQVQYPDQ